MDSWRHEKKWYSQILNWNDGHIYDTEFVVRENIGTELIINMLRNGWIQNTLRFRPLFRLTWLTIPDPKWGNLPHLALQSLRGKFNVARFPLTRKWINVTCDASCFNYWLLLINYVCLSIFSIFRDLLFFLFIYIYQNIHIYMCWFFFYVAFIYISVYCDIIWKNIPRSFMFKLSELE